MFNFSRYLFLVLLVAPLFGADGPRLLEETRTSQPKQVASAALRIDVNMALVPVTVLDSAGHNVLGLSSQNFRVFDGTSPREIVSFGQTDAPVSVGLIYDCSRSMTDKFKVASLAPEKLYKQLNPDDESFLITVSDRPKLVQTFTSNFAEIQNALLFTHPAGSTSLVDGIILGLNELKKSHNPRKALIVVSDGGDNNSRYSLPELAARAAEADAQIFSICLFDHPQTQEEVDGPALLAHLSLASGGVSYMTREPNELGSSMSKIGVTLHNQYVLGYYPPDGAPTGKYRKVKVQLVVPVGLPRLQIYARSGYYVPSAH